ncbi:uncharacterized protein [Halyomorpha halys]|uniref:uncharacterized protein n=1 Tax=Halyomorpha halys TaxID=286706 RepID=UPI0034D362D2
MFSISNLLNFANYFISLTLNTYYFSLMVEYGYYYRSVTMIFWISFRILGSFLIVQSAEGISMKCKHFNEELEDIMTNRGDIYLQNETLLNFLRMKKIFKFNAIRFFVIDKRFYLTMLSMTVSYLVLIFQLTSSDYCET